MSQNASSLDPCVAVPAQLPCPKCHASMTLTDVTSGPADEVMRTFKCLMCNHTETVTVNAQQG